MTARAAKLQQVRHDCLMEHHDCTVGGLSNATQVLQPMDSFGLQIVPLDSVDELDEDRRWVSIAAAISFSRSSALAEGLRLRAS